MNRRPLVSVAICFATGTAIPSLWPGESGWYVLGSLTLFLLAIGMFGYAKCLVTMLSVAALLFSFGERLWVEQRGETTIALPNGQAQDEADAELTGTLTSAIEVDGDLATATLRTASIVWPSGGASREAEESVIVRVKLAKQEDQHVASGWERGDRLRVSGVLAAPGDAGNFGAFDYRDYLSRHGIHWVLNAKGIDAVQRLEGTIPWQFVPLRLLDRFRANIGALMDRLYPSGDAGYMKGLVAGITSDFDPGQYDAFARLGLTHILAISGLHVGVIVFLLLQLCAWARLTRERAIDVTIAMMPVYMLATGASPSAVRACLMAMLALWLARSHRLKDGLHLLAAAAIAMLLWEPRLIENVSFQLSFIVTAGLLLFVPIATASLTLPWAWLRGSLAVALVAQAVSFPVTVYYFHSVHLLSLLANFVLVPFVSFVVMPLGMVSIALGACWEPLGIPPAKLATIGNEITFRIVDTLASYERLRTLWPQPSLIWVLAGFALLGLFSFVLHRRLLLIRERQWWEEHRREAQRQAGHLAEPFIFDEPRLRGKRSATAAVNAALAALSLLWLLWGVRPAWTNDAGQVMFVDVGQGDSILIRTGEGNHVLVDAGGTVSFRKPGDEWRARRDPYEVGRKLLVPLLLQRGVRELDALVLTHLDADHIGGAKAVIENIPVRAILFNGTLKDAPGTKALFELAMRKRIPCYALSEPMTWAVDESMMLEVLYPSSVDHPGVPVLDDQNERSVVLLAKLYGRTFLLPGDLEAEGERAVAAAALSATAARTPVDVLKAAHHGSKTSTTQEWLYAWQPSETVISVGRNNLYGHPHPTVIQRLEASGTRILRTDLDGEVQYRVHPDGTMERRKKR
ncbi:DNA internalization-related competence protein ComEC/Rec2 [Cohnella sp. GCM10027633]|uniref:DNA internalization-related competence protein ComEC/Rec2 n=1 Tax=unclassified Cohnella TaxID=2636738 RepID=UPI00363898F6